MLNEILAAGKRIFDASPETDLFEDVKFTGDLISHLASPVLADGDPKKHRQELLESQDALASEEKDEMYSYKLDEETEEDSEQRRQLAQLNAAFKTIQITGQVARSFAGSLRGDQKRILAEGCFSLGLRLLHFIFDVFKFTKDDFGKALQGRLRKRNPKLTEEEARDIANATIFFLVQMCTYAVIRHVANSIGVEKLSMTFEEIKESRNTIAIRTIDAAIRLEHFSNLPVDLVIDLYSDVKDILLMKSVIQRLAFDRMYYFPTPHNVAQRLCEKLEIRQLPSSFDPDQKKT